MTASCFSEAATPPTAHTSMLLLLMLMLMLILCILWMCCTCLQMLDYPGRPTLATLDNNTRDPKPALLEYIPPLQTRPFDMIHGNGSSGCGSSIRITGSPGGGSNSSPRAGGGWQQLAASWDEPLCVDMPPDALSAGDALLLLEVLQLPGGFARFKVRRAAAAW